MKIQCSANRSKSAITMIAKTEWAQETFIIIARIRREELAEYSIDRWIRSRNLAFQTIFSAVPETLQA